MARESEGPVDTFRQLVRKQTEADINRLNEQYSEYYISAHNQFSELTTEEFQQKYLGGGISEEGSIERANVQAVQKPQITARS